MLRSFHVNTGGGGKLALAGSVATGDVGASKVAVHAVNLSGGTPQVVQPAVGECKVSCNYPCGQCDTTRFPVDKYRVNVPGPWAVAVHVIDALAKGEAPAATGSLSDDTYDPAPKQNAGVLGAAVNRANKQTFVVASSAEGGTSPAALTYGVPGKSPSRHVVFDAPEDASGKSTVTAKASGERCVLSIVAGPGFVGRPLMFSVSSAAEGCALTEATDVVPGSGPPGGGSVPTGSASSGGPGQPESGVGGEDASGGCGCVVHRNPRGHLLGGGAPLMLAIIVARRRARRDGASN